MARRLSKLSDCEAELYSRARRHQTMARQVAYLMHRMNRHKNCWHN